MMVLRANGYTANEIAWRLGLSYYTVKNHFTQIYDRMGASCAEDAYVMLGWMVAPEPVLVLEDEREL